MFEVGTEHLRRALDFITDLVKGNKDFVGIFSHGNREAGKIYGCPARIGRHLLRVKLRHSRSPISTSHLNFMLTLQLKIVSQFPQSKCRTTIVSIGECRKRT